MFFPKVDVFLKMSRKFIVLTADHTFCMTKNKGLFVLSERPRDAAMKVFTKSRKEGYKSLRFTLQETKENGKTMIKKPIYYWGMIFNGDPNV